MSKTVVRKNESLEDALRRFKRSVSKTGTLQEARKREFYEKPSVKRKKSQKLLENANSKEGGFMSLLERLNQDMKLYMKSREKDKLTVVRMVKASLQNEAIKLKKDSLTEDEELTVLSRELKQRKDSSMNFQTLIV